MVSKKLDKNFFNPIELRRVFLDLGDEKCSLELFDEANIFSNFASSKFLDKSQVIFFSKFILFHHFKHLLGFLSKLCHVD